MPTIDARIFWQPKSGHRADEYEDAAFVSRHDGLPMNASVADGATEAAYARQWAQQLVRGFAEAGVVAPEPFAEALARWQRAWQAQVGAAVDVPWYARAKRQEGAYAAFLGLRIDADGRWRALSIDDCCLFHVQGASVASWPFESANAFTNRPALVPSLPDRAAPEARTTEGPYRSGDVFVLATDALAAWLFEEGLTALPGWTPTEFATAVQAARAEGSLRDDDVTALLLEIV